MAKLLPKVDFGTFTDQDLVKFGLDSAERHFASLVQAGVVTNDSLFVELGEIVADAFHSLDTRAIGGDALEFKQNVSPQDGKIATVVEHEMDSIDAVHYYGDGDTIPDGPQRWTGGVHHVARVEINGEWRERVFAGAASGVQGHFDMATVYAALTNMGAAWALQQKALAGC